jgi:hypothetical protein
VELWCRELLLRDETRILVEKRTLAMRTILLTLIGFGWSIALASGASAQTIPIAFTVGPLPSVSWSQFLDKPSHQFDVNSSLSFTVTSTTQADKLLTQNVEIRLYSLRPTPAQLRAGVTGIEPPVWATVGGCQVYLSLVFRLDRADVKLRHQIDFGPLNGDLSWLSVIDNDHVAPGYYLLVVERLAPSSPPSFDSAGGLGGHYEFVRLTDITKDAYFQNGLFFVVKPMAGAAPQKAFVEQIQKEEEAFSKAANVFKPYLHCFESQTITSNNLPGTTQIADNSSCSSVPPLGRIGGLNLSGAQERIAGAG